MKSFIHSVCSFWSRGGNPKKRKNKFTLNMEKRFWETETFLNYFHLFPVDNIGKWVNLGRTYSVNIKIRIRNSWLDTVLFQIESDQTISTNLKSDLDNRKKRNYMFKYSFNIKIRQKNIYPNLIFSSSKNSNILSQTSPPIWKFCWN